MIEKMLRIKVCLLEMIYFNLKYIYVYDLFVKWIVSVEKVIY